MKRLVAIVYDTQGVGRPMFPKDGKSFSLMEMQEAVGGLIEIHRLPKTSGRLGEIMIVDEEGRLKGKEINPVGTMLLGVIVVGNIIISPAKLVI